MAESRVAFERAKPSKKPKVDHLAWEKAKAEFQKRAMLGPFCSLSELPGIWPDCEAVLSLVNRFGIFGNAWWRNLIIL